MHRQSLTRFGRAVLIAWSAVLTVLALAATVPRPAAPVPVGAARAQAAGAPAWNHDPARPEGPPHWSTLTPDWEACGGAGDQSPVALGHGSRTPLPMLRIDYPRVPLVVENTGHVVEAPQPADLPGTLRSGPDTYRLVQWHVHAPSEHVLRGHRYDLEIHLVHRDNQGATLVLAVLADTPRSGRAHGGAAELLRRTLRAAPGEAGEEADTGTTASAVTLLPRDVRRGGYSSARVSDYLTYGGSLTTPPCTTGVRWVVLPTAVQVGDRTVEQLHDLVAHFPGYAGYPDNNRPLQPLGSRTVLRSDG
ncbi:carbonic anhydrase [Krasilnikovia cinnamomea]|uniref:Carbonic anhydrase n=1 Tax=Krasilnikovia cinnamomea TaxID=349313 RepID=A0A4V2G7V4_9ACTN|nr:carbonic anhydrase family protein [Krasilnikovia cinnamomea]RZU53966.1 carbonic anhydrase [Krasilnikovia cinnamomea]